MKAFFIFFIYLLPTLISCYKAPFNSFEFKGTAFVFNGMYMYQKEDSPRVNANGISRINFNYTATSIKPNTDTPTEMEVVILTEDAFNSTGYTDGDEKVLCCDIKAIQRGLCSNQGHILLPKDKADEYKVKTVPLTDNTNSGSISLDVKKTGVYFVVAISCSGHVGTTRFEGTYETINPYGQLPAQSYGSLPFTGFLLICYIILFIWWLSMCKKYNQEIMSVHVIIMIILCAFVLDMVIKLVYLSVYNTVGKPVFILAIMSIVIDCSVRTLTRILTLFVCMGLGVTKANLDDSLVTFKLILFGASYYLISFADSYLTIYPMSGKFIEYSRLFLTSSIDAIVYFWIFISLLDTMELLQERNQDVKLGIYIKLRNLFIFSVCAATLTLGGFSYIVLKDVSARIWRYQWFISDGIWGLFYLVLFTSIMVMWKPSENTSAYAYHIQVATDEQTTDDSLPGESLVDMEQDGGHIVVNEVTSEMKPMSLELQD